MGKFAFGFCSTLFAAVAVCILVWLKKQHAPQEQERDIVYDPRYVHAKEIIMERLGDTYFDSDQKQDALRWIVSDDRLLGQQEGNISDVDHLLQRFILVAFFYQTTNVQQWEYCTPPLAGQADVCLHYYVSHSRLNLTTESRSMRWLSTA